MLLNFYSDTPLIRINYEKLAQLLPVRPVKYRTKAVETLGPALELLGLIDVLESAEWSASNSGIAQLHLRRERVVTAPKDRRHLPSDFLEEDFADAI